MKNHHHTICHNGYWEDFILTSKFSLLANMQIEMAYLSHLPNLGSGSLIIILNF